MKKSIPLIYMNTVLDISEAEDITISLTKTLKNTYTCTERLPILTHVIIYLKQQELKFYVQIFLKFCNFATSVTRNVIKFMSSLCENLN